MSESLDRALDGARARRRLPPPVARRQLRERAGLSQRDIAAGVGVSRESVSLWESGRRTPRPETALRYLELLDLLAREALR